METDNTNTIEMTTTIKDFLIGCPNFSIDESLINAILVKMGISADTDVAAMDEKQRDLCEAKLYETIAKTTPSRRGSTSDADNGWSHSDGGHTFTSEDRRNYLALANEIYAKYDMPLVGKKVYRIHSLGVKPCNYSINGTPLPIIDR